MTKILKALEERHGNNEPALRGAGQTEQGFTLMELLIVMAIIIIIMTVAIPSFLNLRKQANELSAMQSLKTIQMAETQYNINYPAQGFACDLAQLGGTGAKGPTSAQLINPELATGQKAGYTFAITNCTKVNINGQDQYTSYELTAVPQSPGKTGNRGFCTDMNGDTTADPQGGTNCSQPVK